MGVVVHNAGQRRAEAGKVGAAVYRIDAVSEAENGLAVAVIILDGHLDNGAVHRLGNINRHRVAHDAVPVKVADEAGDAALEVKRLLQVFSLIDESYLQAFIEISYLAQALA